jgi:hypothetical protein
VYFRFPLLHVKTGVTAVSVQQCRDQTAM